MFPANGDAAIDTKGSEDAPVALWHWAEGVGDLAEKVESLVAGGLGTLQSAEGTSGLMARSSADGDRWQVVFGRPLAGKGNGSLPKLEPGARSKIGFAVWTGANQERAGIKSVTLEWTELEVEA
jgi:DMSO reductase family type II enzyme heme b subunit